MSVLEKSYSCHDITNTMVPKEELMGRMALYLCSFLYICSNLKEYNCVDNTLFLPIRVKVSSLLIGALYQQDITELSNIKMSKLKLCLRYLYWTIILKLIGNYIEIEDYINLNNHSEASILKL